MVWMHTRELSTKKKYVHHDVCKTEHEYYDTKQAAGVPLLISEWHEEIRYCNSLCTMMLASPGSAKLSISCTAASSVCKNGQIKMSVGSTHWRAEAQTTTNIH